MGDEYYLRCDYRVGDGMIRRWALKRLLWTKDGRFRFIDKIAVKLGWEYRITKYDNVYFSGILDGILMKGNHS